MICRIVRLLLTPIGGYAFSATIIISHICLGVYFDEDSWGARGGAWLIVFGALLMIRQMVLYGPKKTHDNETNINYTYEDVIEIRGAKVDPSYIYTRSKFHGSIIVIIGTIISSYGDLMFSLFLSS